MVNSIGSSGDLGRAAIKAALERMHAHAAEIGGERAREGEASTSFAEAVKSGVQSVDDSVQQTQELHLAAARGELDFHEIAAQINHAKLALDFAMQVRNKLIDAYREVMRMNV